MNEEKILKLIQEDKWMVQILEIARDLNLPDWAIGAGFVRNKVWDYLHEFEKTPLDDIDLVYFDKSNLSEEYEKELEKILKEKLNVEWSVKNQARMHIRNDEDPYTSSEHAMSKWPETVTAIGITLNNENKLKLIAPYGINDLVNLKIRISPNFNKNPEIFRERIKNKNWLTKWPKLEVVE